MSRLESSIMSDELGRRRYLAGLYIDNAALFTKSEHLRDMFPCPICLNGFTRQHVETETLLADLAHVWPESVGGNVSTLTCKRCNNRIGGKYDEHVAIDFKNVAAFKGEGTINARIYT